MKEGIRCLTVAATVALSYSLHAIAVPPPPTEPVLEIRCKTTNAIPASEVMKWPEYAAASTIDRATLVYVQVTKEGIADAGRLALGASLTPEQAYKMKMQEETTAKAMHAGTALPAGTVRQGGVTRVSVSCGLSGEEYGRLAAALPAPLLEEDAIARAVWELLNNDMDGRMVPYRGVAGFGVRKTSVRNHVWEIVLATKEEAQRAERQGRAKGICFTIHALTGETKVNADWIVRGSVMGANKDMTIEAVTQTESYKTHTAARTKELAVRVACT